MTSTGSIPTLAQTRLTRMQPSGYRREAICSIKQQGKTMTAKAMGLLAIWSTVDDDFETDYLHWLTREHVFERVAVPGFRAGRVFRRRGSAPSEYMILYEQDNAEVMSSEGYQARLNE